MDVLKPETIWIENRCYRILHIKDEEPKTYIEDELYPTHNYDNDEEEEEEAECLPIKYENHKFWISLPVPGQLIGYVCGKYSNNIKRIENSTGAQIKIPSRMNGPTGRGNREASDDFVITAEKGPAVSEAYKKLREIMISGRWRVAEFTHFISIPTCNQSIKESFQEFQEKVLTTCRSARGLNEAHFSHPSKLHLTIAMLTLLDKRESEEAKAALNDYRSEIMKILGGKRLRVQMKGIEYMNDDPAEVDVLYGKVAEEGGSNRLQVIAEMLSERFSGMNYAKMEYSLKLHVTLLKSRSSNDGQRDSFDARPILEKFRDYVFGEFELEEIHISTRHTGYKKYYTPLAVITL